MENRDLIVTEFDVITTKGSTQIIKALIPFLAPREQKMIGIALRIWELIQTIRFFEKEACLSCTRQCGLDFNPELVQYIKRYCTPESQHMIDMILQFMNVSELMNIMNIFEVDNAEKSPDFANNSDSTSGSNFGNIMNIFQTMNMAGLDLSTMQAAMNAASPYTTGEKTSDRNEPESEATGPANPSIQPASIIKSMMNGQQASLYQEFMEKLDQDLND